MFEAIAHIFWELPFPLRLLPQAFFVWEPGEGVALFDPRPAVGDLVWQRQSILLPANELYSDLGPANEHPFLSHDYWVASCLQSGSEFKTAELKGGRDGGFREARPYSVANVFLCLRKAENYSSPEVLERAAACLNNLLDVYRFVTMDPLVRSVNADKDCYYTVVSLGNIPPASRNLPPQETFALIDNLAFGHTIGENCCHHIGLDSLDDLYSGSPLSEEHLNLMLTLSSSPHKLELFHQLIFSAIRRLKRGEHALAVLDAESAFESFVAVLIVEYLTRQGLSPTDIENQMEPGARLHSLQHRLEELDRNATTGRFIGSPDERLWRRCLYGIRHRVVHQGVRSLSFADARTAVSAGLHGIYAIQCLSSHYSRPMTWSGSALDLAHLQPSAGRLSRFFES